MEMRAVAELGITRVTEARNGAEALELARSSRPDVVISDLNMPGMDGMTFIGHLAKENLTDSVIIASALTRNVLNAVEAVAVASGLRVLGAIEKPLSKEAIASLLFAHMNPAADAGGATLTRDAAERAVALRQFKAWFEPVLDADTMRVVAVEATARWENPQGDARTGAGDVNASLEADAIAPVARAVILSALASGGLWRQMGWKGEIAIPLQRALFGDDEFWTWLPPMIVKNGVAGAVSVLIDAALLGQEPQRAAFALARCAMDGIATSIRVRDGDDLALLDRAASSSTLTCPVEWMESRPVELTQLRSHANRLRAVIGVTGVTDRAQLAQLGAAGVRRAQGTAVGAAASQADIYATHLATR